MDFSISCKCGCPVVLLVVTNGSLGGWTELAQRSNIAGICSMCGCSHSLAVAGQTVVGVNTGTPVIDSISTNSGSLDGGTAVTVSGHALNIGNLTIKFDGIPGVNLRAKSANQVTLDTPSAKLRLLTQGVSVGTLTVGDTITGVTSGKTALIEGLDPNHLHVSSPSGQFVDSEWVQKDPSNKIQLANVASPLVSTVDVWVENENGQRLSGNKLIQAFTYV